MKNYLILTSLVFFLLVSGRAVSQNNAYLAAMKSNVVLLDSAKTHDDYEAVAFKFERIASMAPKEWLPSYYDALAKLLSISRAKEEDASADRFDDVLNVLNKAKSIKADESEIFALEADTYIQLIRTDPMKLGTQYTPKLREDLEKSIALNPSNPRAWMIYGMYYYFFPAIAGGDKAKGIQCYKKAAELFNAENKEGILPHWGKEINDYLVNIR